MNDTYNHVVQTIQIKLEENAKQYVEHWLAKERADIRREEQASYRQLANEKENQVRELRIQKMDLENQFFRLTYERDLIFEWLTERGIAQEVRQYIEQQEEEQQKADEDE